MWFLPMPTSNLIEDRAVSKGDIDLLIRAGATALAGPKPEPQSCVGQAEPCSGVGVKVCFGVMGDHAPLSLDDSGAADIGRFYQDVGDIFSGLSTQADPVHSVPVTRSINGLRPVFPRTGCATRTFSWTVCDFESRPGTTPRKRESSQLISLGGNNRLMEPSMCSSG